MTYEEIASALKTGRVAILCSSMGVRNDIVRKLSSFIPIGFDLDDWDWCNYIYCSRGGELHACTHKHVEETGMNIFVSDLLDDTEDTLNALDRPDIDELITLLLTTD